MKPLLEADNIFKSYGSVSILNGVSLSVSSTRSLAIIGASGEGKTTLLHLLGALEKPDQGAIYLHGKPIEDCSLSKYRNQHIGFVFQSYNLLEDFSVMDNLLIPYRIARKNVSKNSDNYRYSAQLLDEIGLSPKANMLAKHLSGGEKQRVAIARAFCHHPDIILADEPSGNLDHKNSEIIHRLLLSFAHEKGKSLIIATHDQTLAALCDDQFILSDSKLTRI